MKPSMRNTILLPSVALLCALSFLTSCGGGSNSTDSSSSSVASSSSSEETYTVIWKNYDGAVLETDEKVAKGSTPSYDGEEPAKPEDDEYIYEFRGWDPSLKPVSADITYTATFVNVKRPTAEEVVEADTALFAASGYATTLYDKNQAFIIQSIEDNFKVERGSIAGAIVAQNQEVNRNIEVYYFYKPSVAKYCFENHLDDIVGLSFTRTADNYFLRGNRIYYDSTCEDFFEEVENESVPSGSSSVVSSSAADPASSEPPSGERLNEDEVYEVLSRDYNKIRDHGGYQINLEFGSSVYLDAHCQELGIDRDDLYGLTFAENNIGNRVYIYYFMSGSLASKWHGQIWSSDDAYKVMGIRVICDYNNTGLEDIIR